MYFRVQDGSVRHAKVQIVRQDQQQLSYSLVPEIQFESLQSLLDFYSDNVVHNIEGVEDVKFLYPIQDNGMINNNSPHSHHSSLSDSLQSFDENRSPFRQSSQANLFFPESPGRGKDQLHHNNSFGSVDPIQPLSAKEENRKVKKSTNTLPPALPARQQGPVRPFSSGNNCNDAYGKDDPLINRPPAPLPSISCTGVGGYDPYYSKPMDTDKDMSKELKKALRLTDICECGIPRELSELPGGWTIHRSKDNASYNKGFFQNLSGETLWRLPQKIQRELQPVQKANLRKIDFMFGPNFIQYDIWEEPRITMLRRGTSEESLIRNELQLKSSDADITQF